MRRHTDTLVIYAPIHTRQILPLYPPLRYREITECKSEKARIEKYCVWKLLEKAVREELKCDFDNLEFTKNDNGQWICPEFHFSLSHTEGLVCVAISPSPVGVDVERAKKIREELKGKILTEREISDMEALPPEERGRYLLCAWVKKESIFKKSGGRSLLPNRIETEEHPTTLKSFCLEGEEYIISVCSDANKTEFKYMEEI